jgi:hypothetical protein
MSTLDANSFEPLRNPKPHPENYPPSRPQPDTGHEGWVQCVVGNHWVAGDDIALDFGRDAWGQRFNQGYCSGHWAAPGAGNGMHADDALVTREGA